MSSPRSRLTLTAAATAACTLLLLAIPALAAAQQVVITPNPSITPTTATTPWIVWMAIGAGIIGFVLLVALIAGYMRYGPKFFGREAPPKPAPPGSRPAELVRRAAAMRPPVPAPAAPAAQTSPAPAAAPAAAATAVAVAERPAPVVEPPAAEPAAAEAPPAEAPAAAAEAPAPAPPAPAPPAPAPAATSHGSDMDQETFDRVLQEQLDKGVDRRVAEGRARAAGVVAGRKKAQG